MKALALYAADPGLIPDTAQGPQSPNILQSISIAIQIITEDLGAGENTMGTVLALHVTDSALNPHTIYGTLNTSKSDPLNSRPGINPEHS